MSSRVWKPVLLLLVLGCAGVVTIRAIAQENSGASGDATDDPTADSPLLTEPATPEDTFEAATLMMRIARPELAKAYLQKFLAANPDDSVLLALRDQYGPALFLKLANNEALQPESTTLLDRVNAAFRKAAADPTRVDRLIDDLTGGPNQRIPALTALRNAGTTVVPQMIRRLAAEPDSELRDALVIALTRMGPQVIPPMLGALESPDNNVRIAATEVLGYLRAKQAAPFLLRPAFGDEQSPAIQMAARNALARIRPDQTNATGQVSGNYVVKELKRTARVHLAGEYDWDQRSEESAAVPVWIWAGDSVQELPMPPTPASLYAGARLAYDAMVMMPGDSEALALYLALALGAEAHRDGLDNPPSLQSGSAHMRGLSAGAPANLRALQLALDHRNRYATIGALRTASQLATRRDLVTVGEKLSPLVQALDAADRRVQLLAADAIMQLDPQKAFPKSQRIVEIFQRALLDNGAAAAVIIDPNRQRANDLAALFGQAGFQGNSLTAATGRAGFLQAATRNDVELVAVNANVTQWGLSQTVANLRADTRTAKLPIVIFGPEYARSRVAHLLAAYRTITFIQQPNTLGFLELQLRPFVQQVQAEPLSGKERAAFSRTAAFWLARIADTHRTQIFDLRPAESALSAALDTPAIASSALRAFSAIPTRNVQRRLQAVLASPTYDQSLRTAAAVELGIHLQRHGVLLTTEDLNVVRQLASQQQPPEFAAALATVLGSLQPTQPQVQQRLKTLPPPLPVKP